mgnify:CR=1 FL=1
MRTADTTSHGRRLGCLLGRVGRTGECCTVLERWHREVSALLTVACTPWHALQARLPSPVLEPRQLRRRVQPLLGLALRHGRGLLEVQAGQARACEHVCRRGQACVEAAVAPYPGLQCCKAPPCLLTSPESYCVHNTPPAHSLHALLCTAIPNTDAPARLWRWPRCGLHIRTTSRARDSIGAPGGSGRGCSLRSRRSRDLHRPCAS